MRKPVSILLIALFATTVCADELKSAAGAGVRADVMEGRSGIVERISSTFRRMVKPSLSLGLDRHPARVAPGSRRAHRIDLPRVEQASAQPFQFRLPPPLA